MDEITDTKQLSDIPDGDYILLTKLTYPDHIQKDDRLHKSTCSTLNPVKIDDGEMPTNKHYYHIESADKGTLDKYKNYRCTKC